MWSLQLQKWAVSHPSSWTWDFWSLVCNENNRISDHLFKITYFAWKSEPLDRCFLCSALFWPHGHSKSPWKKVPVGHHCSGLPDGAIALCSQERIGCAGWASPCVLAQESDHMGNFLLDLFFHQNYRVEQGNPNTFGSTFWSRCPTIKAGRRPYQDALLMVVKAIPRGVRTGGGVGVRMQVLVLYTTLGSCWRFAPGDAMVAVLSACSGVRPLVA